MYKKVSTDMNFVEREKQVEKFWEDNQIFEKSMKVREGNPSYVFYDGPPTANGKPHIGHVETRVIKDMIPRYRTMKGYQVPRKAGWDTHGLPVELEVEKLLGLDGKDQIEQYGLVPFIDKCKESVWKYKGMWEKFSDTVGFWADMDNPYVTYHDTYIESEWWALKKIWEKGLLYKGHKVVPYCPRCGTALSSHEVAQGYKDVKELSVYAKFPVEGKENEYILAWTTTPWTLPSNVALVVNANEDYVKVSYKGEVLILAKALVDTVLKEDYEILETFKGSDLKGVRYTPLFDFLENDEKGFYVVTDDYVTLTDGTGVVHTAPAFGEDDYRVGRVYGLPFRQYVDTQGNFTKEVTPWAGRFVKDCDKEIIKYLEDNGTLFAAIPFEHSYPHCWRCDTPLLYYARSTWFIEMTKVRDKLVANNDTIEWYPENVKYGRFGNFIANVIDWGLSRERYWGTPLPVWECECGYFHTIGSVEELRSMSDDCPEELELHKPYIDAVHIKCPKCGKQMTRVPEVIDCWFDSGSAPFAQWHYPFENQDIFEKRFPADFITEAVDQTRGWFYSMLAVSTLVFDTTSYTHCMSMGHVLDKYGIKMSKHKGNVVDPWTVMNKQGADAIRWYFYVNSAPWLPCRFDDEAVDDAQRKFMGTFWNTYAFYVLYANIDNFNPMDYKLEYDKLPPMDKWILSKLNTLVKYVDDCLGTYKITEPARALQSFVDDMSNWYVRRSRERFWAKGMEQDKINAYMTLYTALVTVSKAAAPMIPFMTEEIYQNLVRSIDKDAPESIHLCDFPEVHEDQIDKELENNMEHVLDLVVMGRACRNASNIKNRQPIGKMFVKADFDLPEFYQEIVADELNVKNVKFTDDVRDFTSYSFKPQLKTVGPKYGKMLGGIKAALNDIDGNAAMDELNATGALKLDVNGQEIELFKEDLLIDTAQIEGYESVNDNGITVVLDTNLSPELLEEGFVREIISKIQTMRKEADFEVMDRIKVTYEGSEKAEAVFEKNNTLIAGEVLADEVVKAQPAGYVKEWKINGEAVTMGVEKKGE